ncbi:MAG: FAD-dependent oxidoreductase [Chloroflexi bacterium]|nr:FAD-dependent oxidoreductase [Chloroflexota bacterium]
MTGTHDSRRIVIIGAGVGGLTTAALLAQAGYTVTVLEGQTYPGGCAGTFYHQGYRFDAGATLAGGFQPGGPHAIVGEQLGIEWPIHPCEPAWVVHLPDRKVALTRDNADVLAKFPETEVFWREQNKIADLCWSLSGQGLPWPPTNLAELMQLAKVGLANFPADLKAIPFGLGTVSGWLKKHGLDTNSPFVRFIDAQLLISAQTVSQSANGLYGATALDLARQGVNHVEGGIGGLAETLVEKIHELGGHVLYRQRVTRIKVEGRQVTGVYAKKGIRATHEEFFPADFVVGNLTPWSLDHLLGEASPKNLRREVAGHAAGFGAFVLHVGVEDAKLPPNGADHHQIITSMEGPLGEGRSIFVSMSSSDSHRAPTGMRAVTITTHTAVQQWWDLLCQNPEAYQAQKDGYAERMIAAVDQALPGFRSSTQLLLPGSPVTYEFYTTRHLGMVGGFPMKSLFAARSPRTGIANLKLVGDSIFPGQSTAGVTLGAIRVAKLVQHTLPIKQVHIYQRSTLKESSST